MHCKRVGNSISDDGARTLAGALMHTSCRVTSIDMRGELRVIILRHLHLVATTREVQLLTQVQISS